MLHYNIPFYLNKVFYGREYAKFSAGGAVVELRSEKEGFAGFCSFKKVKYSFSLK